MIKSDRGLTWNTYPTLHSIIYLCDQLTPPVDTITDSTPHKKYNTCIRPVQPSLISSTTFLRKNINGQMQPPPPKWNKLKWMNSHKKQPGTMAANAQKSAVWNFTANALPMVGSVQVLACVLAAGTKPETKWKSFKPKCWPIIGILDILKGFLLLPQAENAHAKNQCAAKNTANVSAQGCNVLNSVSAKAARMVIHTATAVNPSSHSRCLWLRCLHDKVIYFYYY